MKAILLLCFLSLYITGTLSQSGVTCSISAIANGQSCEKGNIICPPGLPCVVRCTSSLSCYLATIDATQATSLDFYCPNSASCQQATLRCPPFGTCNIHCTGSLSCYQLVVASSSTLAPSFIECTATSACQEARFICPSFGRCTINCLAGYSCYESTISASNSNNLGLDCEGGSSCQGANVVCPSSGDCAITCPSYGSCYGSQITATPNDYLCLSCTGQTSCQSANVYASRWTAVNCAGQYSCAGTQFTLNEGLTDNFRLGCGDKACQGANLRCGATTIPDYASIVCTQSDFCATSQCAPRYSLPTEQHDCPNGPQGGNPPPPTYPCYCPCTSNSTNAICVT